MKRVSRMLLSLLCVVFLLCAAVPMSALTVPGGDFAWTSSSKPMLIEQILQRDGLIDGIWFPWFDGGNVGHSLTGNDLMVRYRGNGWSKVALDTVGADKIYREIYNLKSMGFNLLGYGGSIYDEGVIHDAYGDVIGVKQEFLDNARRLLDMCREIGMPVMWTICFHSSSSPNYHGMDAWNIMAQKYANPTIAKHYAEKFARPVCQMLAEYPDVVALVAITDEIENEINDSEEGNHFDGARAHYGVTEADMVYFMEQVNKVCKEELPHVARTMASNDDNKAMYDGFTLDLMGHNRYDNNANIHDVDYHVSSSPMIMTEYNIGGDGKFTSQEFAQRLQRFREQMVTKGYKGGIQWAWMHNGNHNRTAYYLLDSSNPTDFIETVSLMRHYIDDYRNAYQGKKMAIDTPVMYANDGTGLVEWIPSRNATRVTVQRSDDGGETWKTLAENVIPQISKGKGIYRDTDSSRPKSGFCYRVTMSDGKHEATSAPNQPAGAEAKYKKASTTVSVSPSNLGKDSSSAGAYQLTSFGVATNRPYDDSANLIKNGSFESTSGALWNVDTFIKGGVSVVTDKTAPSGSQSLYFNTSGKTGETWYTFTVPVQPNTDYIFSAWVKGTFLSANNAGHASIGVIDPITGKFMIYPSYRTRSSRANRQIYPTAWDDEWHLRSVAFNSQDLTEVTIALCGDNSKLWVDDIALYKNGEGLKYVGARNQSYVRMDYDAQPLVCKDSACLLGNTAFSNGDTFWKTGNGWQNGFLSVINDNSSHGKVLRYKEGDGSSTYYIKWIDVKPHTTYSFAFDIKVKKSGAGSLMILDDCMTKPAVVAAFAFDTDIYGTSWGSYYVQFNTANFSRIGIAVCDLGGEALMDNLRLFKTSDGTKDTSGQVHTMASIATTTRPEVSIKTTAAPNSGNNVTQPTSTVAGETTGSDSTTDTAQTDVAGDATDATQPSEDADAPAEDTDVTPEPAVNNEFPWGIVGVAGGAAVLIAGGVTLFLILRKKKLTPPTE